MNGGSGLILLVSILAICLLHPFTAFAGSPTPSASPNPEFGARKIFFMLFLMLGPIKILVPFVNMTRGRDAQYRRRLATRATLFSAAALALAGLLGRSMIENFDISVPVLAMTGGIVLFLVALQTVLQQSSGAIDRPKEVHQPTELQHALAPLAFPTIVTPYGIAAVIVFMTLASEEYSAGLTVAGIVLAILVLDWIAMLFAETILKWVGTPLQVFAWYSG